MSYGILQTRLHGVADEVQAYFRREWGVGKFAIEKQLLDLGYRPTLSVVDRQKYYLCIEVSETAYSNFLDSVILDSMNRGLAIRLFVAVPAGSSGQQFELDRKLGRVRGVGLLFVDPYRHLTTLDRPALPLSLTGARPIEARKFPARYRQDLQEAQSTYDGGNPPKACACVYDIIESVTRRLGRYISDKNLWNNQTQIKLKWEKAPWANILDSFLSYFNCNLVNCPNLTQSLLHRIRGETDLRNQVGHAPRSTRERQERDAELRTRFETATDVLKALLDATRPIRGLHR